MLPLLDYWFIIVERYRSRSLQQLLTGFHFVNHHGGFLVFFLDCCHNAFLLPLFNDDFTSISHIDALLRGLALQLATIEGIVIASEFVRLVRFVFVDSCGVLAFTSESEECRSW